MVNGLFGWGSAKPDDAVETKQTAEDSVGGMENTAATKSSSSSSSSSSATTTTTTTDGATTTTTQAETAAPVTPSTAAEKVAASSSATTPTTPPVATTESAGSKLVYDDGSLPRSESTGPSIDPDLDYAELAEKALDSANNTFSGVWDAVNISMHFQNMIAYIHETVGLPWWASVATLAFSIRMLTFPLTLAATKAGIRMTNNRDRVMSYMKKTRNPSLTTEEKVQAMAEYRAFTKANKISQGRMMLPVLQAPLFIGLFVALRSMAANNPNMEHGGALWFMDMSIPDPYSILPAVSCVLLILSFELGQRLGTSAGSVAMASSLQNAFIWAVRIGVTLGFFFFKNMPAILFMYWIPSSIFQMFQQVLLRVNPFKRWFKVPDVVILNTKDRIARSQTPSVIEKFLPSFLSNRLAKQRRDAMFRDAQGKPLKLFTQNELSKRKHDILEKSRDTRRKPGYEKRE